MKWSDIAHFFATFVVMLLSAAVWHKVSGEPVRKDAFLSAMMLANTFAIIRVVRSVGAPKP